MEHVLKKKPEAHGNLKYIDNQIKGQNFDAVYFRKSRVPETTNHDLKFLKLTKPEYITHNVDVDSDRWLVFLYEGNGVEDNDDAQAVYFRTYLGDPLYFVKNQVKARSDGLVVRDCNTGYQMLLRILGKTPTLDVITSLVRLNYIEFLSKRAQAVLAL